MVQGQRNLLLLVLFSVIGFVIGATTTTTTTIQPLNPEKARSKFSTSGAVNKDGSFEFILENEDSGIFIEIEGKVSTSQGKATLELAGTYEFKGISLQFVANEEDGLDISHLATKTTTQPYDSEASV